MLELQRLASTVVANVLRGRSLDAELRAACARHSSLSSQDRGALQDITYGTLRFLGEIDAISERVLDRPLKHDRVRDLLRVALYQLLHTRAAPYAIVDHAVRTCAAIGQPAAQGLVNAVLRTVSRKREVLLLDARRTEPGRYSHPQWWIEKLRVQYPQRYGEMLDAANARPPLTLRVNRRRTSVEEYVARLADADIDACALGASAVLLKRAVAVEAIPGFAQGEVSVQDASAQEAALCLDLQPGQHVLDACAAPGGKTAHILETADADVLALDNDPVRVGRIRSNLERLDLRARLACGDAADPRDWWDGKPFARILADVPCSASGVVRRHPDIKWLRRPEDIQRFAQRERTILEALWQLLATDGKLLYATCSLFYEENNGLIEQFLDRHPDAQRVSLPGPHTNAQRLAGQILPDQTHDGFFYALLQKI